MNGKTPNNGERRPRPQQRPGEQSAQRRPRPQARPGTPAAQRPQQRPSVRTTPTGGQTPRPRTSRDINEALNERYEEMVSPGKRADDINRGKYADLSTFESKGHRKIDPKVMRAKRQKEMLKKAIPLCAVVLVAAIALFVYFGVIRPSSRYDEAVALFEKGDYSSAEDIFRDLEDYEDTKRYLTYIDGYNAYKDENYPTAIAIFESLDGFYNSGEMLIKVNNAAKPRDPQAAEYERGIKLLEKGEYASAYTAFSALGDYKDSKQKAKLANDEKQYAEAVALMQAGDSRGAKNIFDSLGDFRDSAQLSASLADAVGQADAKDKYNRAKAALERKDYRNANILFNELGNYLDSKQYADYTFAVMSLASGDYGEAYVCFKACGDLLDAPEKVYEAGYAYAGRLYSMHDEAQLPAVIEIYAELGNYLDSAQQLWNAKEQYRSVAVFAYAEGDLQRALDIYTFLGDHPGCKEQAERIRTEMAEQ